MNTTTTLNPIARNLTQLTKELAGIAGGALAVGAFVFVLFGAFEPSSAGLAYDASPPAAATQHNLSPTVLNRRGVISDQLVFEQLREQG